MPFTEAVEYLKARTPKSAKEYYDLSDKLKYKAFTVSRIADGDTVEKIKGRITKALEEGGGLKDFLQMQKEEVLNQVGLGAKNGWYWETVFRAGSQSSYNTGRMLGFESDPPIALQFIGIEDSRQTEICHSLSNIIRPYGDPFWDSRIPPLHFGCRSTIRGIYDESEIPAKYPEGPKIEAAKGWGFNPLKDDHWFEMFPEMEARAENYGLLREIEFARKKLLVRNLEIDDLELMASANDIKQEVVDIIAEIVKPYERRGELYINDFIIKSIPPDRTGTPLLQIEPTRDYTLVLNINKDKFAGKTLEEIDAMLARTTKNLAKNLREAIIHECGHAKSLRGKTIKEIDDFYKEIANARIAGISEIALEDGAEALAEIEILISRDAEVPNQAMNFYNKYMGKK